MNKMMSEWYEKTLPSVLSDPHLPNLPLYLFDDSSLEVLGDEEKIVESGMLEGETEASLEAVGLWREDDGSPGT